MIIEIHVKPGSNENKILEKGTVWKIAIKAKPEEGKANAELIKFDGKYYRTDIGFDL